ncbi:MAG: hypothetical protein Q9176_001532 [Flavoplaca citrina]
MDRVDFDKPPRQTYYGADGSEYRIPNGDSAKSATDAFASSQRPAMNGTIIDGRGLAAPTTEMPLLSQPKERPRQLLPDNAHAVGPYQMEQHRENRDLDMSNQMESLTAPFSPSDDELLDGESESTVPIAHPKLLATGLCYDIRMRYHSELDPPKQRLDFHPEDPRRIYHIYRALCQAGLYKDPQFNVSTIEKPLERIQARNATASEICLVHTANHYNFVASTAGKIPCMTCRKILILDWDVHHGNGIQQAFEQDPNVLYISIHVHDDGNFYPLGPYGDHMHCGAAAGLGKNINIPWPTKGMGDSDYLYAFQQVVMPVAYDFNPDLVIIAAGFDAAVGDQLGGCFVTPTCYAHMTHMLMSLANGKLVVCLEGGYNLASISKSALAVTRTLLGEPPDRIEETRPTKSGAATVDMVGYGIFEYIAFLPKDCPEGTMHDAIRAYQKQQLRDDFDMMELAVFRERISKSFKHQVLATINYADAVPLIVFFHDPYHHQTGQNPNIGRLTDAELYDPLSMYREWAITAGFAVIDEIDELNLDKDYENAKRIAERNELAIYLWENYIELNESTAIFFVGVGSPAKEIVHILNNRETFFQRISGIILFLDASNLLPSVSDHNTYYLSKWFKQNSLVFVSGDHPIWIDNGGLKKPGKRFGAVKKSEVEGGVNDMLERHRGETVEFVEARIGNGRGR